MTMVYIFISVNLKKKRCSAPKNFYDGALLIASFKPSKRILQLEFFAQQRKNIIFLQGCSRYTAAKNI